MNTQTVATIVVAASVILAALAYLGKRAIDGFTTSIQANAKAITTLDHKINAEIRSVRDEIGNLKSDLPLVYVLREDFIRNLNNVEQKINGMDNKLDQLLQRRDREG